MRKHQKFRRNELFGLASIFLALAAIPAFVAVDSFASIKNKNINYPAPAMDLWAVGDSEKLFQNSTYQAQNYIWDGANNQISLTAAKNETVGFQVALRAPQGASSVNVVVSDLTGPSVIRASENIDLYLEHFNLVNIATNTYPGDFGFGQAWPDALIPFTDPYESNRGNLAAPFNMNSVSTTVAWVDVYIPENMPVGEYNGTVSVYAGSELAKTANLKLTTRRFALPHENHLYHYGLITSRWGDGEGPNLRNYPSSWPILKNYLIDGRKHRLSWDDTYWPVPTFASSTGILTSMNWTLFDTYKGQMLDGTLFDNTPMSGTTFEIVRMNWPIGGSYPPGSPNIFYQTDADIGNPIYENQIRSYIEEYVKHFVQKGWNMPLFVYGPDEVGSVALHTWWADLVDEANANLIADDVIDAERVLYMRTRAATPADPNTLQLVGKVDFWMTRGDGYDIEFFQDRQSEGDTVGFYHWSEPYLGHHTINTYGFSMRAKPLIAWKYDIDAIYSEWSATHWQYTSQLYNGSASDYYNTRWGNGLLYYPGRRLDQVGLPDIDGPVPSIRLKNLRRGMQDYEYAWMLEDLGGDPDAIIDSVIQNALSDRPCNNCLGDWSHEVDDWYSLTDALGDAIEAKLEHGPKPPDDTLPSDGTSDDDFINNPSI